MTSGDVSLDPSPSFTSQLYSEVVSHIEQKWLQHNQKKQIRLPVIQNILLAIHVGAFFVAKELLLLLSIH